MTAQIHTLATFVPALAGQPGKAVAGGLVRELKREGAHDTVQTDETFWGYIVRANMRPRSSAVLGQWFSGFVGVSLVAAAIGFWVMPGSDVSADMAPIKLTLSGVIGVIGMMMIWYAAQISGYELQVDIAHGELRQAVRNGKGQVRLLSRVPFERIGAVVIDRTGARRGQDLPLMLRYRDTAQMIEVVRGREADLVQLRDRLAHDILGMSALRKRQQDALRRQAMGRTRQTATLMRMSGRG